MSDQKQKLAGVLWGTAVGDSLGLPAEGISRSKLQALGWTNNWTHRLIFGKGMLSDDTEHTIMVAQALVKHPADVEAFQKELAWKLRWWLLMLPAGVGMATARSIMKLWLGFPPSRSGVFSAGNGPAMRSAILGVYFSESPETMENYVRASTNLTHTDPKALVGALAVAYCAAFTEDVSLLWERLESLRKYENEEWPRLLELIREGVEAEWSTQEFTAKLGIGEGVTGYVYHTVPVALFVRLRWQNAGFERILVEVLNCGGDTDTTGAIVGAMAGTYFGFSAIPQVWCEGITDWPLSKSLIDKCADSLSENREAPKVFPPFLVLRNLIFLVVVLSHGLLRLLPCRVRKAL